MTKIVCFAAETPVSAEQVMHRATDEPGVRSDEMSRSGLKLREGRVERIKSQREMRRRVHGPVTFSSKSSRTKAVQC